MGKYIKIMLAVIAVIVLIIVIISYNIIVVQRHDYVEKICIKNSYPYVSGISCVQTDCDVTCCLDTAGKDCAEFPVD